MYNARPAVPAVFLLMTLFTAVTALGQPPSSDPNSNPRKVRTEPRNAHKEWLENDVAPIVTPEERRAFLALKTDEERENFIENFWRRRDPNPDTEENEYREEYYERVAYANEHFTSGKPGVKTDRGRIYLKWGKPDSIESRPSGGSYDRPVYQGGGSTTTYPFEVWFYRYLEGVGSGVEIEFVDRTGTGDYSIARSPEEKDALAMGGGGVGSGNIDRNSYIREQDTPFYRLALINSLEGQPPVKFGDILGALGQAESPLIDNNPLDFDLRVDLFRQSEDRSIAVFTIQTDNRQLAFEAIGGIETAKLNVIGRITSVAGRRAGMFEDSMTATATRDELVSLKERSSVYQKAVALPPGKYKIDVGMRDVSTGNKGVTSISFEVPRYNDAKLSTSTMILASKLRPTDAQDIGGRFVIGSAKVIPNVSGRFKPGQDVGVYMQVYNSEIDQTTLRPAVDADFVLFKEGKEIIRQREDWTGLSDSGQRITLARILPTASLAAGEYELKVVLRDRINNQTVENKASFTIEK